MYGQSETPLKTAVYHHGTTIEDYHYTKYTTVTESLQDFSQESYIGHVDFPRLTIQVLKPQYSGQMGKYRVCWCIGALLRQVTSHHDFQKGWIWSTGVMLMLTWWRHDMES